MMPIEKMEFSTTKRDGRTVLRGHVSFTNMMSFSDWEINACRFDLIDHEKERMRHKLWEKTYGEIIDPLRELEMHAKHSADQAGLPRVLELIETLNKLLTIPKPQPAIPA